MVRVQQATAVVVAAALCSLTGCDYVFAISKNVDAGPGGEPAAPDAPPDARPRSVCWTDTFNALDTSRWRPVPNTAPAITISVAASALEIDFALGGAMGREALVSQDVVDFTDGILTARLVTAPHPSTATVFALELANGTAAYRMEISATFVGCYGAMTALFQYDKNEHVYFRMRHLAAAGGTPELITFEHSKDGIVFLPFTMQPVATPVDQLVFVLAGRIPNAVQADTQARWDDVEFSSFACP